MTHSNNRVKKFSITRFLVFGGMFVFTLFLFSVGGGVLAAPESTCPTGTDLVAGICIPTEASTGLSDTPVIDIVMGLMNWLLLIFGFIAIIGFVISGIQYLTSAGQEDMAESAKRNMKYSIIGVIVALSGWVIIQAIDTALNATNVLF